MKIKSYWKLFSPSYVPMALTTALAGAVTATNLLPDTKFFILAIAISLLIGAFNAYNAIADKDMDKVNKPERPLPRGEISETKALWIAVFLYAISLGLSLYLGLMTFILMLISTIITVAYSAPKVHLKKTFIVGTFSVAFFYASICFALGWSLYPTNAFSLPIAIFLLLLGAGLSITKDFMDFAGDAFHMAHTLPVKIGYKQSIAIIITIITIAFIYLSALIYQHLLPTKFLVLLIFYPLMISNVFLFKKYAKNYFSNELFTQTMILIVALELTYAAIAVITI